MPICSPRNFLPGDEGATSRTWGLKNACPSNQYLGNVPFGEGLSIGFPNIYQYKYTEAELEDPEKEGFIRILGLFLVDPDLEGEEVGLLSTLRVPPQQKEWMRKAVEESIDVRLPNEIVAKIVDMVEGVMTEDQARLHAEEVKKERERFWSLHDERWFCLPFDVWSGTG